ncbi:cysteate synthase [Methanoculleus sp. FWC-SCC1]|uniref:Cysteate synthase n=1 Tax=Methanoculleus frigidifontis TaxID=2584085 RepID=A0ABT8MA24_9EURY|nr:cysteate synthase [Methanoculleus sp. FWC-SCC1]MDN7024780.1 cysteate synthase [Methanoculleus sp. FWC-SCC1]
MDDKYRLQCLGCWLPFDDHYTLECPAQCTALVRTYYRNRQLDIKDLPGMFRYIDWLPVEHSLPLDAGPVSYRSEAFARELGLEHLIVTFSGYWPERKGNILTCSFKELEAQPTVLRLREKGSGILQIASAGNTGRAFCQVSALTGMPVVVVVPAENADRLWTTEEAGSVCLITIEGDYTDAIQLGREIATIPGITPEGGARNVARRDGMGTTMLDGTLAAGRLPDYYFQAVGSGTGGIAAWEAAERLIGDGRFGTHRPELHLSQNVPFIPMVRAWEAGRDWIRHEDMPDARQAIAAVSADVLTNREPPYGVKGGVYDALVATRGRMYAATNDEARSAGALFTETEGIDLDPAAAVCVASLVQAVERDTIDTGRCVLLNITGGGYERVREDHEQHRIEPFLRLPAGASLDDAVRHEIAGWVASHA